MVLGGTGHIGSAIARRLEQDGYTVTASGLRHGPRPNLADTDVTTVQGDDQLAGVAEAWIAGHDLVVDAATPYPVALFAQGNANPVDQAVARTRRLLLATAQANAAFVHVSSFTTLPRQHGAISQIGQGVLRGLHSYFDLKTKVEAAVKDALVAGQDGCIINPATCFGPYDLKPKDQAFIPMLLAGKVAGLVRQEINVIDVRDVADIIGQACMQGFPTKQIPAFGHNISLANLVAQICRIGGTRPPRLQVPALMGLAGLYWMETVMAVAGRPSPWPSLSMMLVAASYPAPRSPEQVALHPELRPLSKTLQDAVTWYRKTGVPTI